MNNPPIMQIMPTVKNPQMRKCKLCDRKEEEQVQFHTHHIIPKSEGGTDDKNNLIDICADCHYHIHHPDDVVGSLEETAEDNKEAVEKDLFSKGWGIIPNVVLRDSTLTHFARILYCELSSLCGSRGYCWASNAYLANLLGADKRTISRTITQLSKYLVIKDRGGSTRTIRVHQHGQMNPKARQKSPTKVDKPVIHNSISNSINNSKSNKPLPDWLGKNSVERLAKIYEIIWKHTIGQDKIVKIVGMEGASIKRLLRESSEAVAGMEIILHFEWKGPSGTDEGIHRRLADNGYPLAWIPGNTGLYKAYIKDDLGLETDEEIVAKIDKLLKELGYGK